MAKATNFNEVFGAIAAQQTVEISGRIDNATQSINDNTTGAVSAAAVEISGRIDNATQAINNNTAGTVAQGTAETVAQVRRSESNILAKLTGEKEWWFIILEIAFFAGLAFIFYLLTMNVKYAFVVDSSGNARADYSIVRWFLVFAAASLPPLILSATSIGDKKVD